MKCVSGYCSKSNLRALAIIFCRWGSHRLPNSNKCSISASTCQHRPVKGLSQSLGLNLICLYWTIYALLVDEGMRVCMCVCVCVVWGGTGVGLVWGTGSPLSLQFGGLVNEIMCVCTCVCVYGGVRVGGGEAGSPLSLQFRGLVDEVMRLLLGTPQSCGHVLTTVAHLLHISVHTVQLLENTTMWPRLKLLVPFTSLYTLSSCYTTQQDL